MSTPSTQGGTDHEIINDVIAVQGAVNSNGTNIQQTSNGYRTTAFSNWAPAVEIQSTVHDNSTWRGVNFSTRVSWKYPDAIPIHFSRRKHKDSRMCRRSLETPMRKVKVLASEAEQSYRRALADNFRLALQAGINQTTTEPNGAEVYEMTRDQLHLIFDQAARTGLQSFAQSSKGLELLKDGRGDVSINPVQFGGACTLSDDLSIKVAPHEMYGARHVSVPDTIDTGHQAVAMLSHRGVDNLDGKSCDEPSRQVERYYVASLARRHDDVTNEPMMIAELDDGSTVNLMPYEFRGLRGEDGSLMHTADVRVESGLYPEDVVPR